MWYVSVVRLSVRLSVCPSHSCMRRVKTDRLSALSWFLTPMLHSAWLEVEGSRPSDATTTTWEIFINPISSAEVLRWWALVIAVVSCLSRREICVECLDPAIYKKIPGYVPDSVYNARCLFSRVLFFQLRILPAKRFPELWTAFWAFSARHDAVNLYPYCIYLYPWLTYYR